MSAAAFVVLLLPAAVLALFNWDLPSLGAYHDDSVYVVTARAIAQGKGYRIESLPDERWQTKYPPAFPLALAAVWRLLPRFPENVGCFLLLAWLAAPVLIIVYARLLAKLQFPLASQLLACLCLLAYEGAMLLSVSLLSDLWFCCEVLFVILLAERASAPDAPSRSAAAAGLAAALACLTKTSGVVLLVSVPAVMILRRRWRNALVFCAVLVPPLAIWIRWSFTHLHPVADYNDIFYSSYFQEFAHKRAVADLLSRLALHAGEFLLRLGGGLILLSGGVFDWLGYLVGILGVAGIVRLCRSGRAWHYAAFAGLYALEMCIWPSPLFPRYVLPVVPLCVAGLLTLPRYYRPDKPPALRHPDRPPIWGLLAVGVLAFSYTIQCAAGIRAAAAWRSEKKTLEPAYAWIARSVPPTSSFVAFRDPLLYLYTGRHAEGLHSSRAENGVSRILNIAEFARGRGHRYVLIGPKDPEFDASPTHAALSNALQADRACRRVYSAQGVDVYDVMPAQTAPPR